MTSVTQRRLSHFEPYCLFYLSQSLLVYCHQLIAATRSIYLPPHSCPAGALLANTLGRMRLCFEAPLEDPQHLKIKRKDLKPTCALKLPHLPCVYGDSGSIKGGWNILQSHKQLRNEIAC